MSMSRTRYILISLLMISLLFFVFSVYFFLLRDDAPIDDSDLHLTASLAPAENNGYLELIKIGEELEPDVKAIQGLIKKIPFDLIKAKEIIGNHRNELDAFYRVLKLSNFGPGKEEHVDRISNALHLIQLVQLQGRILLVEGRSDDALKTGVYLVELGHKYEHCHGKIINNFIGINIKTRGLDLIEEALKKTPAQKAKWIQEPLRKCQDSRLGFIDGLKIEYTDSSSLLDKPNDFVNENNSFKGFQTGVLMPLLYKRNKTKNTYISHFRSLIDFQRGVPNGRPRIWEHRPSIVSGNYLGESLIVIMAPNLTTGKPRKLERRIEKIVNILEK